MSLEQAYLARPVAPLSGADRAAFWADGNVAFGPDCWEWRGLRNGDGYGFTVFGGSVFSPTPRDRNRPSYRSNFYLAHRVSYATSRETILPVGVLVCHHCDNPPCVRSSHLFRGTILDNNEDRDRKLRTAHGERFEHAVLTKAQVREAVARHARGESIPDLAAYYGVHRRTLAHVLTGATWGRERSQVLFRLATESGGVA